MERIKNVYKNSVFAIASQLIIILAGFIFQRTMNLTIGQSLVGVNAVISNIINIISVSELGLSTAVVFHLYDAIAKDDRQRITTLVSVYRRFYLVIGGFILVAGLIVLPFIHFFMKENPFTLGYTRTIYALWLVKTVLSYPFSYKRSILIADQKDYICSIATLISSLVYYVGTTVLLLIKIDYIWALVLAIVAEVSVNIILNIFIGRQYPFLSSPTDASERKAQRLLLWGDIRNVFISRLAQNLLVCTDNLIISGFISVVLNGLYANYCLITHSILNIMLALNNAITPTLGNIFIEKNSEKNYNILRYMTFTYFLIASFVTTSLVCLFQPFIGDLWLDQEHLLPVYIMLASSFACGIRIIGFPLDCVMNAAGLFKPEKRITITSAIVNVALSVALVLPLGLIGVITGTIAAYLIMAVARGFIFTKNYCGKPFPAFLWDIIQYYGLLILEAMAAYKLSTLIYRTGHLLTIIPVILMCLIMPFGVNLLIFCKGSRFSGMKNLITDFLNVRKQKS